MWGRDIVSLNIPVNDRTRRCAAVTDVTAPIGRAWGLGVDGSAQAVLASGGARSLPGLGALHLILFVLLPGLGQRAVRHGEQVALHGQKRI